MQDALAHHQAGRTDDALKIYAQVLAVQPQHAHALHFMGLALQQNGDVRRGIELMARSVRLAPREFAFHSNLGNAYLGLGELEAAVACFERALKIRSDIAELHHNLAMTRSRRGELDAAIASFREALRLREAYPEAHNGLGVALLSKSRLNEAQASFVRAIEISPSYAAAHSNLGTVLLSLGKSAEAIGPLQQSIAISPNNPDAYNNLANAHRDRFEYDEALAAYRQALMLDPKHARIRNNYATALHQLGLIRQAVVEFTQAIADDPLFAPSEANLALCLLSDPLATNESLMHIHQSIGRRLEEQVDVIAPRARPLDGRKLRVGYVSGDLRKHSVAYFIEAVLRHHDRSAFEIVAYYSHPTKDDVSLRLGKYVNVWNDVAGLTDAELAQKIANDQIDVLVDLSGHTTASRLGAFARKPAPVQMTWIGYPSTTGLSTVDYRIVDAITDPEGSEVNCTEQLVRLAKTFLCFTPPEDAPPVALRTSKSGITFGCFNALHKISEPTLDLWIEILTRLPESNLMVKSHAFSATEARQRITNRFSHAGIHESRLLLAPWIQSTYDHFSAYSRVDVALDTSPYNGTTTTCEAMWMGVPVVTLAGDRHAARVGASLLHAVGLREWIAHSPGQYVEIAVELASDPLRLSQTRLQLRDAVASCDLSDGATFTRGLENAYHAVFLKAVTTNDLF